MTEQEILTFITQDLNLTLGLILAIVSGAVFYTVGRARGACMAHRQVVQALDRGARDIRAYSMNRQGAAAGEFGRRALEEAEYIIQWRTIGENYLNKPEGVSRLRAPNQPRSRANREELQRQKMRRTIINLGYGNKADDTYVGPRGNIVLKRYNPTGIPVQSHRRKN